MLGFFVLAARTACFRRCVAGMLFAAALAGAVTRSRASAGTARAPEGETMYARIAEPLRPIFRELGIHPLYPGRRGLTPFEEAGRLVDIGPDVYARPQQLAPEAAAAWKKMKAAALRDRVQLQVVSGFRSVAYQREIFLRKKEEGQALDRILQVNVPPGYSEHHSGRALDLTAPGGPILEEGFESTPAFRWLSEHAAAFGFRMTYPRDNSQGIAYEPWHWAWHPAEARDQKSEARSQ